MAVGIFTLKNKHLFGKLSSHSKQKYKQRYYAISQIDRPISRCRHTKVFDHCLSHGLISVRNQHIHKHHFWFIGSKQHKKKKQNKQNSKKKGVCFGIAKLRNGNITRKHYYLNAKKITKNKDHKQKNT